MIRSNHWKFWLVLFPIIGTCALANFPGGMKGFFAAWSGTLVDYSFGSLFAEYKFVTDASDTSGNGYNGNISNVIVSGNAKWNQAGGTVVNDPQAGAQHHVNIDAHVASFYNGISNWSISCWFNLTNTTAARYSLFGTADIDNTSAGNYINLRINNDRLLNYTSTDNNGIAVIGASSPSAIATQTWHHLVFIGTGTTNEFWLNGARLTMTYSDGNSSTRGDYKTGNSTSRDNVRIGQLYYKVSTSFFSQSWSGFIDNFRIYKRALTQSEIQQLYAEGYTP